MAATPLPLVPAIGIDLGTTFSCVAVVKGGQVQTIYNGQGHYVTPSWVSFIDGEILVGEPARIAAAGNAKNTLFNAKRLIGRQFSDWKKDYEADSAHWPFKIFEMDGQPYFEVTYEGRIQYFSPQKISSYILSDLKKSAEDFLQQPVKDAVISVPANFNYAQRQATEEAAKLAGFNVLRLCSEPAMAGIMHEPLQNIYHKKILLVFDCGGGTTDVAVLSITQDGTYDVLATAGNMYLGGENIVDRLVVYFLSRLKEETGKDYSKNEEAVRRLKRTCEECKCQLSFAETYTICFDYQCEPKSWKITRGRFNTLCADLFDKMLEPISEAIAGAGLEMNQIDEVLLAGGTSRILDLQNRLSKFFKGKPLRKSVNPEQAIAQGAAVMAAVLSGDTTGSLGGRQLCEVAPLSLSIGVKFGELDVMVPRNTKLPYSVTRLYYTAVDYQDSIQFAIYEGERFLSNDCTNGYLGEITLLHFKKARRLQVKFTVTFKVSASGVMHVTAVEPISGRRGKLDIMSSHRQRDSKAVLAMVQNAAQSVSIDAMHRQRIDALKRFENQVYSRKHFEEDAENCSEDVLQACEDALRWINLDGQHAPIADIDAEQYIFTNGYGF